MRGEVMVRINILRQISARGKVRDVIEFVKDFRENGKKIILFCSLHEVVDQLKRYFPTAVSVTGRDSQDEKQRAVDAFQNNPKADIIICSIKAAGVGLTTYSIKQCSLCWSFPGRMQTAVNVRTGHTVSGKRIL